MFVGQVKEIEKVKKLEGLAPAESIDPPPPPSKKLKVHLEVHNEQSSENNTDHTWLMFQGYLLTESINDQHINYAQMLLHKQFPAIKGLHNTLYQ